MVHYYMMVIQYAGRSELVALAAHTPPCAVGARDPAAGGCQGPAARARKPRNPASMLGHNSMVHHHI